MELNAYFRDRHNEKVMAAREDAGSLTKHQRGLIGLLRDNPEWRLVAFANFRDRTRDYQYVVRYVGDGDPRERVVEHRMKAHTYEAIRHHLYCVGIYERPREFVVWTYAYFESAED